MNLVPVEKNKEYIVKIIDNGFEGEGIAKIDNFTIFVSGAIKGETVKILILKVLSSHAFGKILEIIDKAKERQESDCITYKRCGGCNLRHIQYKETLKMNIAEQMKTEGLDKSLLNGFDIKPIQAKKAIIPVYEKMIECSLGSFELTGERELLDYLYKAGIGSKKAMGFGLFEIIN